MNEPRDAKTVEKPSDGAPAVIRPRGPYFMAGEQRFTVRGLTYGPFPPETSEAGDGYPEAAVIERDLDLITGCGANVLRVYTPPPARLRDACARRSVRLLAGVPWAQHLDFLENTAHFERARSVLCQTLRRYGDDPTILGFVIANEIPVDIVRWHGRRTVRRFLEELIDAGRHHAPDALFTYAGFPPTEDLHPRNQDFLTFNVFLHDAREFQAYLRRLRLRSQDQPIILGELGMDTLREGHEAQARMLAEQVAIAGQCGFAGSIIFSFTDQWHTGGRAVDDWAFGVVTAEREAKPAWEALKTAWKEGQETPVGSGPLVSVIVCAYNAALTLPACLDSLRKLRYPKREILLIDDGSTDETEEIATRYPEVRHVKLPHGGLSAARNHGAREARGEVLAYTDADCVVEPDWLDHLVTALTHEGTDHAIIGGPNVPPPTDDPVERALADAPGGPREVMLTDTEAEHLPGCNLAMWRWTFEKIGGFDPVFQVAGDDVDFCWRATDAGLRLGFAPRAVVWHPRRGSLPAYFKQQRGYGAAEKVLLTKHPHRFNHSHSPQWRGTIYEGRAETLRIYRGRFGLAGFPAIYSQEHQARPWLWTVTVGMVALMLLLLLFPNSVAVYWLLIAAIIFVGPVFLLASWLAARRDLPPACFAAKNQAQRERVTRIRARMFQRLARQTAYPDAATRAMLRERWKPLSAKVPRGAPRTYWSQSYVDRQEFLNLLVARLRATSQPYELDNGWQDWDLRIGVARLYTVLETHRDGFLLKTRMTTPLSNRGPQFAVALALILLALLLLGLSATVSPGEMLLMALVFLVWLCPLFWFWPSRQRRIAAALDLTAREYGLKRVHPAGDDLEDDTAAKD